MLDTTASPAGAPASEKPPAQALANVPPSPAASSDSSLKPLHHYYEHLLKFRDGQLVPPKRPTFLRIRSNAWFLTAVVCIGTMMDLIAYAIIIPVLPFRLEDLGHSNVAALMSWLLFAYSVGILIATFPVAFFFHRYPWRRWPLIIAVIVMEGSFVLFMLAQPYWCMVLSRVIQGACSCVVWTVGFALICENTDPDVLGMHLGFAFAGLSIGTTIAPPIGGALYRNLGWKAPFIFLIILCGLDTIARIFILEKKDIRRYEARVEAYEEALKAKNSANLPRTDSQMTRVVLAADETEPHGHGLDEVAAKELHDELTARFHVPVHERPVELGAVQVVLTLASLPRGMVAFMLVFVFGFIIGAVDSTLTVRISEVWHKDSDYIGLLYLAAAAPAFFGGPISGWVADKYGSEWVILPAVLFCLPWLPIMTLDSSLAAVVVAFAMCLLTVTVLNSVASLEMAIVSRFKPGISEIHEFAAMNLAFALSSAIGAIVGGQIYDHVKNGWNVVCWIGFAAFAVSIPPPLIWTGKIPLLSRILGRPPPKSCIPPEEREYWAAKARGEDPDAEAQVEPTAPVEAKAETAPATA